MPGSDISRLSVSGAPKIGMAMLMAKEAAQREIGRRLQSGQLNPNDKMTIDREFRAIYSLEYYKYYATFLQHEQPSPKIIYVPTENPSARKYFSRHSVATFTKLNYFIQVNPNSITVGKVNFPIDQDKSLETKEAFLTAWPGPLDRHDENHNLKGKTTGYIDTLWQHDSQRRIRYSSAANDDQRKVILKLLTELLHRNGTIDAPGVTRLLLKPEYTEIQKDEGNRRPLETLQKYLLLGKRSEAVKYAKSRKLWDHAQCLAFLDKYQPPNSSKYQKDGSKLKDDSIVQLNDEYINSIEHEILNTVYRSLLNRILRFDPESSNIIKHPNVGNNFYEFAILSANDCEMEFDQSNELFRLIVAVKQAATDPIQAYHHLISLGDTSVDSQDPSDELSYRSHLSFRQVDTYESRTWTISNIDMMILNEIWEYSLNLAKGTCNPVNYEYIINLVPYKLVFASRLLDYGRHSMFAGYLNSIKEALKKSKLQNNIERDSFYDWDAIERSVEYLDKVWEIFLASPDTRPQETANFDRSNYESSSFTPADYNPPPAINPTSHSISSNFGQTNLPSDYYESNQNDYPSLPYQNVNSFAPIPNYPPTRRGPYNVPPPLMNQQPIPEENDFNPAPEPLKMEDGNPYDPSPYNDHSNETSRRPSASQPTDTHVFSPPPYANPVNSSLPERSQKAMTSSSPVDKHRDSTHSNSNIGDSFSAFSPINEYDDLPRRDSEYYRPPPPPSISSSSNPPQPPPPMNYDGTTNSGANRASFEGGNTNNANKNSDNKSQPGEPQPPGSLTNWIVGSAKALLPKSNSKQMILPDDSSKTIVYDDKRGTWVDTTQPEGTDNDDLNAPPPMMPAPPQSYSFSHKSTKTRYPKAQF